MKRVVLIVVVTIIAGFALSGCEELLGGLLNPPDPATPMEQVAGFLAAASADPQDPLAMQAFFDPDAADYPNMYDVAYWDLRFFNSTFGPYDILGAADAAEDPDFPGSVTVTGFVTNSVNADPGYPAVFVITSDPLDEAADPLIRKITVTVTDPPEVIENQVP